ncbi:hypothetical protein QJS04_geneDACA019789 [Acorus gramineus]|uniref:Uncharacterized protein n=1 Tax=Acorus gramineus TaxID=55184 RepID=A0AAV8ZYH0_ACOGR|nr:hypothetical protein QJS04_geneDACA019789 [Acorus gramineus]
MGKIDRGGGVGRREDPPLTVEEIGWFRYTKELLEVDLLRPLCPEVCGLLCNYLHMCSFENYIMFTSSGLYGSSQFKLSCSESSEIRYYRRYRHGLMTTTVFTQ